MNAPGHTDVAVVGAGITGLCVAHFLARRGVGVRVVEASQRSGGVIQSERVNGFLFEHGPSSALQTTPVLEELFSDLSIWASLEYANPNARRRYIVRNGCLRQLPTGPLSAVRTGLFSARGKLRVLVEPFVRRRDATAEESVAQFVTRRLGREILDYAIDPFVSGVYAGVPEKLSVRAAFPKLYQLEQRYGSLVKGAIRGRRERKQRTASATSGMLSFKGGMQELVDALTALMSDSIEHGTRLRALRKNGDDFQLDLQTSNGSRTLGCRVVILTIPAHAYDGIDLDLAPSIHDVLQRIPHPPVSVVFFGYHANPAAIDINGFGFLVPAREKRGILGTLWNSSLFPGRAPQGGVALTTYIGGARAPEAAEVADERLVDSVRHELRQLMGIDRTPDVTAVKRWPRAIPQYNLGHDEIIGWIEKLEARVPGFHIAGNFRGGISVVDCIGNAHTLAHKVADSLPGKPGQ